MRHSPAIHQAPLQIKWSGLRAHFSIREIVVAVDEGGLWAVLSSLVARIEAVVHYLLHRYRITHLPLLKHALLVLGWRLER